MNCFFKSKFRPIVLQMLWTNKIQSCLFGNCQLLNYFFGGIADYTWWTNLFGD